MEKCFCHFNGYKVKDADARQMASNNASLLGIHDGMINNQANEINEINNKVTGISNTISGLNTVVVQNTGKVTEHETRLTALESGGGSGGGSQLYHHTYILNNKGQQQHVSFIAPFSYNLSVESDYLLAKQWFNDKGFISDTSYFIARGRYYTETMNIMIMGLYANETSIKYTGFSFTKQTINIVEGTTSYSINTGPGLNGLSLTRTNITNSLIIPL